MLTVIFSAVLLGVRRLYPYLRGIGALALGFCLGVPATILLAANRRIHGIDTFVAADALACLCYLALYRGILGLCELRRGALKPAGGRDSWPGRKVEKGHFRLLAVASAVSILMQVYFTVVSDRFAVRIVLAGLTIALARTFMAVTLIRNAAGRTYMRLFGLSLAGFAGVSYYRCGVLLWRGAPLDLAHDYAQSMALLASFVFMAINSVFYVVMIVSAIGERMEEQAQIDFLTGTLNRRGMEKVLQIEIARTRRHGRAFSVLLIDVDRFKAINDLHGHAAGDDALRRVAARIETTVRIQDKVGRFGGDEFLLLLPETDGFEALQVAAHLRETIQVENAEGKPVLTLSIGATECAFEEEAIDMLARVDSALYEAKRAGRDCARLQMPMRVGAGVRAGLERN
jgi:diguanylate cyclase (GGDEF)-like protein